MGERAERIEVEEELQQVRKQASRIQFKAIIAGLLSTVLALLI